MAIEPPHIPGLTDWRPLARGGFAVVWEARQETLDRLVAVKVDQRRLDVEAERLRFLREAGAAGRMSSHPGIVTVHDAGILPDDRPYLVMELCPGGSLTSYLNEAARPGEARVREIGVRIADALAATHERGVLHRDVKPANILIDAYDRVGLADFGLAALPGPQTPPQEAFQALTPAYTAPEILRRQPPAPSGDVYSLAATLYALLGGRPPRWPEGPDPSLPEVLRRQQEPLTPLPEVDPALMAVLERALDLDPRRRPTAAELRDQLGALDLASSPGPGRPTGVARRAQADDVGLASTVPAWRRRGVLVAVAVLALLGVLVGSLALLDRGAVVAAPAATPALTPTAAGTGDPTAAPTPEPETPATSSPTTGDAVVPAGYTDCSSELGRTSYCPRVLECWAGIISVFDLPSLGTPESCDSTHVYQTFAAGPLTFDVRRQSQLESDSEVGRLCSRDALDALLDDKDQGTDWEVLALPPQEADGSDQVFRCLFGRGDRTKPVELTLR